MDLHFIPVKTRIVHPPQDDISDIIDSLDLADGDLVFITSKILGLSEGRTVKIADTTKEALIRQEAQRYLPYTNAEGNFHTHLTVTHNVLISSAGIDESNADGYYVMWPADPDASCRRLRTYLMARHHLKNLGVIATDSHTVPLRWGVTGTTIGFAGVAPLRDARGEPDLFGRPLHATQINLLDPLTGLAVLLMGESAECTPIVILKGYTGIPFSDTASMQDLIIDPSLDRYAPLLEVLPRTSQPPDQHP